MVLDKLILERILVGNCRFVGVVILKFIWFTSRVFPPRMVKYQPLSWFDVKQTLFQHGYTLGWSPKQRIEKFHEIPSE